MTALLVFIMGAAILACLWTTRKDIMSAFDDLKAAVAAYSAKVDAYVAAQVAHQQTVEEAIAAAIAKDDADEDVDINALAATVAASAANVPEAPVAPTP